MTEKIQIIHKRTKQIRIPLFYVIVLLFVMGTTFMSSLSIERNGFRVIDDDGYISLRSYEAFQVSLLNKKSYDFNAMTQWDEDFDALAKQINRLNDFNDNILIHNTYEKIYIPTVDTLLDIYPDISQRVNTNELSKQYLQAPRYFFGDYLGYVTHSDDVKGVTYQDDQGGIVTVQNMTPSTVLVFKFLGQLKRSNIAFALKQLLDKADSMNRKTSICYIRQYKSLLFFTHNELIVELINEIQIYGRIICVCCQSVMSIHIVLCGTLSHNKLASPNTFKKNEHIGKQPVDNMSKDVFR